MSGVFQALPWAIMAGPSTWQKPVSLGHFQVASWVCSKTGPWGKFQQTSLPSWDMRGGRVQITSSSTCPVLYFYFDKLKATKVFFDVMDLTS